MAKAKTLKKKIGLSEQDSEQAWITYCGQATPKNVDPSALKDLIKWLETRA